MYEIFPHTADVGLRVRAPDLNTLFAEAAQGFFSLIVTNLEDVQPKIDVNFDVESGDLAYLLADWLNELLFTFESRCLLLSKFHVEVNACRLKASAMGERVDESRHALDHEIKAVTYHGLRVERMNGDWIAEAILDI
ncbi:MAG TPA: archease [Lacipirellulaceae bacterium]|nr:archease [Lacipirellulaceae bacterium]